MKKIALIVFAVVFMASAAYAETTKEAVSKMSEKAGNFWSREGERSGLKESTASWGNFWKNINPGKFFADQKSAYEVRKTGTIAS